MIAPASPTVRRRRLAAELRGIRESRGKSGDSVAAALKWSPSKISRYERARTGLRPREVERLLDYYGISGPRRDLLLALAEDAAQKGWWEEFSDTLSEDYQQFIGLEHEAATIAIWHVDVVTGLLQTEAYARHIISSYSRIEPIAPGMIGRLVRVRMRRQEVLNREGLHLSVVLDESILKRRIGNDSVMYEQLQHLAHEADRPNLTLQILPLDAQHTVTGESFVIFGFGEDERCDVARRGEHGASSGTGSPWRGSGRLTCTGLLFRCSPRRPSTRPRPGRSSSRRRSRTGPGAAGRAHMYELDPFWPLSIRC